MKTNAYPVYFSTLLHLSQRILRAAACGLLCGLIMSPMLAQAESPPEILNTWTHALPPLSGIRPQDVAVDDQGLIYVLDREQGAVVKYLSDGTPVAIWGNEGVEGRLWDPTAIAIDKEFGEVYVADIGLVGLHVYNLDGVLLRDWAPPFWLTDYLLPRAIEIVDGSIYVISSDDPDFPEHWSQLMKLDRVTLFSQAGISAYSGQEDYEFNWPHDVAVDPRGRVYVADRFNNRIQVFDLDFQYIETWDEYNTNMFIFNEPLSVAVDAQGDVFVGEDGRILKFSSAGSLLSEVSGIPAVKGLDVFGSGSIYAANAYDQKVTRLGYPPQTVAVRDVSDDQGGWVRVSWGGSELDRLAQPLLVTDYVLYRRNDMTKVFEGWDIVATVPARGDETYQVVVPTLADSTMEEGVTWSTFVVSTQTGDRSFFDATPDSGYSVDNIAPGAPEAIVASYQAASVALDWNDALETDFQYYRIYRGTDPGFVPLPANLVQEASASAWTDLTTNPWDYHYKITTLDHAGNESEAGSPETLSGVEDWVVPPRTVLLGAVPNPFNPSTKLSFEMAAPGHARLKVFDTAGRLVATLVDGHREAGRYDEVWDGRDTAGRMPPAGVYLYRLEADGYLETKRVVLIK